MRQLLKQGYSCWFHDNICEIENKKSGLPLTKVNMTENNMFPLDISCLDDCVLVANVKDPSWLWHLRYGHGHVHFNGLKLLGQKNMIFRLPLVAADDNICEVCAYGKQHRMPFPVGKAWRAKDPLALVHEDICGPVRTPSLDMSRYFLLFTDDFSHMSWVFFLVQKSEALKKFKEFKAICRKRKWSFH